MKRFAFGLFLFCLIGLSVTNEAAGASSKHWRASMKQADEAWKNREFAKARAIFEQEAAEAAELGSEVAAENSARLAEVLMDMRQLDEADRVLSAALEKLGPNPVGQVQQVWRGVLLADQAHVANRAGRAEDALGKAIQARTVIENVVGSNHPELFRLYRLIGQIYMRKQNYVEAEKAFQRALKQAEIRQTFIGSQWTGPNEDVNIYVKDESVEGTLRATTDLGRVNVALNNLKEAENYFQKGMRIAERQYGKKHQAVVLPLEGLAYVHLKTDRRKEFEADVQRMFDLCIKAPGLELWVLNPFWLKIETDLKEGANLQPTAEKIAQVCFVQNFDPGLIAARSMALATNDPARVEALQNAFRTAAVGKYSAAPLKLAPMLLAYARAAEVAQKPALALADYEALAKTQETAPEKSLYLGSLGKMADAFVAENKPAEALPLCQKITAELRKEFGDDSRVADAIAREAGLLKQLGRDADAAATEARAAEVRKKAFSKTQ